MIRGGERKTAITIELGKRTTPTSSALAIALTQAPSDPRIIYMYTRVVRKWEENFQPSSESASFSRPGRLYAGNVMHASANIRRLGSVKKCSGTALRSNGVFGNF